MIKISDIKPYANNAKKHPKSQLIALAKIVKEVGWRQPVLVNQKGVIVAGHGRWATWKNYADEYSLKDIWIIDDKGATVYGSPESSPLTEEQENSYRFADNKLNESDWDMKLALVDLKLLSLPMFELTGFDKDILLDSDDKDDVIPERVPSRSKLGDIYELGHHRLLCGDSTKEKVVLSLCAGKKVDMFLTDPPYNVSYVGKTKDKMVIDNDSMENAEFKKFLVDAFTQANEVMKRGAVFYIWHADSSGYDFRGACKDVGFKVRQFLIWNKNHMVIGRQDYHWMHEPCLYGWKDGASHLWNTDRKQTTVLNFMKPNRNLEHPTMKPVELMSYLVCNNSKEEDIILDLFGGGGSTLIACEKTGRVCNMLEIDPRYVDVIVQRWVDFTGIEEIKKNGKIITWKKSLSNADDAKNSKENANAEDLQSSRKML